MAAPRVVVVHRTTEYAELLARHGTAGQASFFLASRGRSLADLEARHASTRDALRRVLAAIPADWRRATVERAELPRFVFGPEDLVVVVGPDGLVANLAKYTADQPVLGIDPLPGVNAGVLVTHPADAASDLLRDLIRGRAPLLRRTMVQARSDDGQTLTALNELYVGQPTHQSARYTLTISDAHERQSSSGIIVGTGTGATGWCRSLQRVQAPGLALPGPQDAALAWFVREPWPSPATGATLVSGLLAGGDLTVDVESDTLVVFGDGLEDDRLTIGWGQRLTLGVAPRVLTTVR